MASNIKLHLLMFGLVGLFAILGFASTATALSSEPLLMIDGSDDSLVDIMAYNADPEHEYDFGFYDGGFNQILSAENIMATHTFSDGDIVDFAIENVATGAVYKLSDGNAMVTFNSDSTGASIIWTVGTINVVTTLSAGDSFAFVSTYSEEPVPEPTAALTFAAGLLFAGWRVRRQPRS
jgi:hypothetical protein